MKAGILFNPFSGAGKSYKIYKWIKEKLKKDKIFHYVERIEKNVKIKRNLERLKEKKTDRIIILGGDGTLFHIANTIENDWNIPFSLFPSGSGNDFIKSVMGLNKNLEYFYENFKYGDIKKTNIGKIETETKKFYFSNAAGIGFDAKIAKRALKIKNLRGLLRYLISLFIELKGKISYLMEIESEDLKLKDKFLIAGFGVGKFLGGGFFLFPDASPFEDKLSVCLIKDMTKIDVLKKLPHAIKGTHLKLKEVIYFKAKKIKMKIKGDVIAQMDGEVFKLKEKEIEIHLADKKLPITLI